MQNIANNIFSRDGLLAFANAIGFYADPITLPFPGEAVVEHVGTRGTLRALLITCADFTAAHTTKAARQLRHQYANESQLYMFVTPDFSLVRIATFHLDNLTTLTLEKGRIHAADVDVLLELVPQNGAAGLALALQHARALDRVRVTNRFFADFRGQRAIVADAWLQIPARLKAERAQLALLLLSRLLFLYFLQRRGFLCGNSSFFVDALRTHLTQKRRFTFYRGALRPLFFGVLNRRPENRTRRAAALGPLPYLNGGLFERHHLERRFAALDLPDACTRVVFESLLERYRFTSSEGGGEHAVDPEMLGRVFEGLMADSARQSTGTFYTPATVVTRMVRGAFDAHLSQYPPHQTSRIVRELRVLDPACGSGAFLLGALGHMQDRLNAASAEQAQLLRRHTIARNLHGVDVQHDAALLCALRLWLTLIPADASDGVQPLPSLDRRIRQGDALVDPLDLAADNVVSPAVRAARRALQPLLLKYSTCDPEARPTILRGLRRSELRLARAWVSALRERLTRQRRELLERAASRDLFGNTPSDAQAARFQLRDLDRRMFDLKRVFRDLERHADTPFFSFNVHLADAHRTGFDIILCNPPWVRSHNWPRHLKAFAQNRYAVCRDAGQVDLALLFLERSITLLSPGGTLAIILPAKFLRTASAGAARALLLQHMQIISIEDHSLDQNSIFGADAFATVIIARKFAEAAQPDISVTMIRRKGAPSTFPLRADRLRYNAADTRSPWLIAPAAVRAAMTRMLENATTIGAQFRTRRGVVTGKNGTMLIAHVDPKIGNLAAIRSDAGYESIIESDVLRPVIRGCDVAPWIARMEQYLVFSHDDASGAYRTPPRRAARYLREHLQPDARGRIGALQHTGTDLVSTRVAWHDLADTLKAVVLPATTNCFGTARTIVPINTVYYIPTSPDDAHLLAAYFNSLPIRTFARAIAERAKDSHFRFFACTVSMLPLPHAFRHTHAEELRAISRGAHEAGAIESAVQDRLDRIVAQSFGLGCAAFHALQRFDRWLDGSDQ